MQNGVDPLCFLSSISWDAFCGEPGAGEFVDQRWTSVCFLGRRRLMNRFIPSKAMYRWLLAAPCVSLNGVPERAHEVIGPGSLSA